MLKKAEILSLPSNEDLSCLSVSWGVGYHKDKGGLRWGDLGGSKWSSFIHLSSS